MSQLRSSTAVSDPSTPTSTSPPATALADKTVWLRAWFDPVASVTAYSSHLALTDLNGDGDDRLVLADGRQKQLRIYKGSTLSSVHALLDYPTALCAYYMDMNNPRKPVIAIASGCYIFLYRNLKPYFKFSLPPVDVEKREKETWTAVQNGTMGAADAYNALQKARTEGVSLTSRSLELLGLSELADMKKFCDSNGPVPITNQTVITCMSVLNRDNEENTSVAHLVVGTENGSILILEPAGDRIQHRFNIPDAPVFLVTSGCTAVEYRIFIATRNSAVYTIKNNELQSNIIELPCPPVGLVRLDKSIVVACNNLLISFNSHGKKQFSLPMPAPITTLEQMRMKTFRNVRGLIVALSSGEMRVYNGKILVSKSSGTDPIVGLRFGRFGREEHTLITTFRSGSLGIDYLPRKVDLEADLEANSTRLPGEQDVPLNVPKKSRLYIEQAQREMQFSTDMHRLFQRDLCSIRLLTARSYVKLIREGQGPQSFHADLSVRLNAVLHGLGPMFRLRLEIQNTGKTPVSQVPVAVSFDPHVYAVEPSTFEVPLLIPGLLYTLDISVECRDVRRTDQIRAFVLHHETMCPVVTAVIQMPVPQAIDMMG